VFEGVWVCGWSGGVLNLRTAFPKGTLVAEKSEPRQSINILVSIPACFFFFNGSRPCGWLVDLAAGMANSEDLQARRDAFRRRAGWRSFGRLRKLFDTSCLANDKKLTDNYLTFTSSTAP
jgi:hypothetical protein